MAAKVVTAAGEPVAGVMVGFSMSRGKNRSAMRSFSAVSRRPDGLAVAHPSVGADDFRGEGIEVTAGIAGAPATTRVTVPLEKRKEGPITVVVGATGRIVVKLRDPEGQPFLGETRVSLIASKPGKGRHAHGVSGRRRRGARQIPVRAGRGNRLHHRRVTDFDTVTSQNVATLSVPGENVTVEVRLGRRKAVLKGRAVDDGGAPIPRTTLFVETLEVRGPTPAAVSMRADTDSVDLLLALPGMTVPSTSRQRMPSSLILINSARQRLRHKPPC